MEPQVAAEMEKPEIPAGLRALSIAQFCTLYGVSHNTATREIKRGALKAAKLGRRVLIPCVEAEAWLRRLSESV